MADTTTSSGGNCVEQMKSYVRTQKGTILAAEILISFIIIICYAASAYAGISTLAICEMIFAIVFFVIFMMGLDKQFKLVNWMWSVSLDHHCDLYLRVECPSLATRGQGHWDTFIYKAVLGLLPPYICIKVK
uniref:Uncharacterized protein n=1 Tax=Periophthalmus magnuspinnatus TaxID=409849 RepID=A0A3B4AZP0_9GOBI